MSLGTLIRRLLGLLGYRIEYVSQYGKHSHRYDGVDAHMGRPIHPSMSVAPPWAKRRVVKVSDAAPPRTPTTAQHLGEQIKERLSKFVLSEAHAVFSSEIDRLVDLATATAPRHREEVLSVAGSRWVHRVNKAAHDVLGERWRQVHVERWTEAHDDEHAVGDLPRAAAVYALYDLGVPGSVPLPQLDGERLWPWHLSWLKPKSRRENLVRATALLLAAIEQEDRAEARR